MHYLSNEKSEREEIFAKCGFSWDDIKWILKIEDIVMFSRLYWGSRGI
jgi:hypothetical protein